MAKSIDEDILEYWFRSAADHFAEEMSREADEFFGKRAAKGAPGREYEIVYMTEDERGNEYEASHIVNEEEEIRQAVENMRKAHARAVAIAANLSPKDSSRLFDLLYDLTDAARVLGGASFGERANRRQTLNGKSRQKNERDAFDNLVIDSLHQYPKLAGSKRWRHIARQAAAQDEFEVSEGNGAITVKDSGRHIDFSSFRTILWRLKKEMQQSRLG
jgi:hypothetical protein